MNARRISAVLIVTGLLASGPELVAQSSIPSVPSVAQLRSMFASARKGEQDPFVVIGQISQMKDAAVPVLIDYLNSPPDTGAGELPEDGVYAVTALDGIATVSAFSAIAQVAASCPCPPVRAAALRVIAGHRYELAAADTAVPDKEVLHLLMQAADDTTFTSNTGRRIGQIARDGIHAWMGVDLGELSLVPQSVRLNGSMVPMQAYREHWWNVTKDKVSWNPTTARFEVAQ